MKKILLIILLFVLCSCSTNKIERIKHNFSEAGFTHSNDISKYLDEFNNKSHIIPHLFILKEGVITNVAIVLEFQSTKELKKTISESETIKGIIKDLRKSEYVNGNCLLLPIIPLSISKEKMIKIFNK